MEGRLTARLNRIEDHIDRIREDIAGIKIELATHTHEGD